MDPHAHQGSIERSFLACRALLPGSDRGNGGSGVDQTLFCPNGHGMVMDRPLNKAQSRFADLYSITVMTGGSPKAPRLIAIRLPVLLCNG